LKGFARISLEAGESKTIAFAILPEQLSFTDINKKLVVESGDFEIMIGNSSRDQDLTKVVLQVI
jgi:beta-glucosidase